MSKHKKKRLLITGASGLLGSNAAYHLKAKYDILGLYHVHEVKSEKIMTEACDILDSVRLKKVVDNFNPEIVMHCAALADMEFCESHSELTEHVNILGTKTLADCLKRSSPKLVYLSTDSVYDGLRGNYLETNPVRPQSIYSESKYRGEWKALAHHDTLIVRTSFFGWNILPHKLSLAEWVVSELSQQKRIQGFRDVYTSILYTLKLVGLIDEAIDRDLKGIFHFASRNAFSKYDLALTIAREFHLDSSLIDSVSVEDVPFKARRSKNLSLNTDKLSRQLGVPLPTIEESVRAFHQDCERGIPEEIRKEIGLTTEVLRQL